MKAEELRLLAMGAFTKAKALKEEFSGKTMDAAKLAEFNSHMEEFASYNDQYEGAKKQAETFAAFTAAEEQYAMPSASQMSHEGSDLAGNATSTNGAEKLAANHTDAFARFMKYGERGLNTTEMRHFMGGNFTGQELMEAGLPQEHWAHVGTVDTLGGFLVPEEFMSELIKDLAGASVMRSMAKVRQTSRSVASFLTVAGSGNISYSSGVTGSFRSEGWVQGGNNIPTQNQPRFGKERVPVHIWSPDVIEITMELLEDAGINLESEVRDLLQETRRLDEDSAFILGNGVGMPRGIHFEATSGNIATVNSQAAAAFTYDGLVDLWTELPAQYRGNASYLMNSKALGEIALIQDTQNRPIFPTNEIPTQLFGSPIRVSEFMPDVAASAIPVIYGDFSNYGIADRMDLRIIRLNERFAPNIGLLAVARVGGQMLRDQPFVSQTISA